MEKKRKSVYKEDCVPSECLRIDLNVTVEGKSFRFNQVLTNALHHFYKEISNKIEYRFEIVEEINLSAQMFDEFLSTIQWYCEAKSHLWKLEHLLELWDAARVLNIVHLIRTCERKVGRIISEENFETVYAKANHYKSEIVLYKARSFLQKVWLEEDFKMSLTHVLSYSEFYHLIKYRPDNNYEDISEDIILRSIFEWVENFEKQVESTEEISQELVKLSLDKRENGDRDSFLEDKLEESSKLSRLLKASKYNSASIECLKELSIHQLCKKDREAELILTKAISFKLDKYTHGYWPPGAFERNKVGYRHIGVLADEDQVCAMLLEEEYFLWMEVPRCPLHSKITNLTVFDNELYTVSSSGLESLIFVYRNKEWKFVLDLPNEDFVVVSKGECIYVIDGTSSSVKCVSPRETPVLHSEIKFPVTMRNPESALDFDKSILIFCSTDSDEKSAVISLDVPEHKWTDCGHLEGSAKNLVGFRNETNYFILQRDGTISQVLRNQDDSIEFTVIKRLWSIQSAVRGAFIYNEVLYVFSNTPMESLCLSGVLGAFCKIEYWHQERKACDYVHFFMDIDDVRMSGRIHYFVEDSDEFPDE
ncbi:kelch protein 8 [Biomphalaria glabrata]|nr:kelch protein 8 [Biomphalaria glabrata]